eukprot:SM000001S04745  [mRNA]  locus=s1:1944317:1949047:- [translate_table: standard]
MAATMYAVSAGALVLGSGIASSQRMPRSIKSASPFLTPIRSIGGRQQKQQKYRPLAVRNDRAPTDDLIDTVKDAVKGTKVNTTADKVRENMAREDEKRSVVGTVPSKTGTTIPRPEIERRPETGDTTFQSVMAFDGPGPETINGRLAMVGFFWGLIGEYYTHKTIVQQVTESGSTGLFWLLVFGQVFFYASLVPMFQGESPDSRVNGPFNAQAERWNGRTAMLGFAGLLAFEAAAHRAFIDWGPAAKAVETIVSSVNLHSPLDSILQLDSLATLPAPAAPPASPAAPLASIHTSVLLSLPTMAATCAMSAVAGLGHVTLAARPAASASSFSSSTVMGAPLRTNVPIISEQRQATVMVRAQRSPLDAVKDAIDSTKVNITPESVKANQDKQGGPGSEKQSVVGTVPAAGTTIPRPELERRPETGDRSFGSLMAFDGPAPETINGRLAMLGCAWAAVAELVTSPHQPILQQVAGSNNTGLYWLIGAAQVVFWSSLVPLLKAESPDSRSNGPFNAKAERWNGRLAMIGFAGLLIFEQATGHSFF